MRPQGLEYSRIHFLIEDWLIKDPILRSKFCLYPKDCTQPAQAEDGTMKDVRWILTRESNTNVAFITDGIVHTMPTPLPLIDQRHLVSWKQWNPADPQFFEHLREYLMLHI